MAETRTIIGVDLGTTNTAVAYVDTRSADPRVRVFEIPQLVAPGEIARRRQLPSFVYLPGEHDLGPAETALPWAPERRHVVGELARAQGARMPSRMVSSAKSWLCHGGVDRHAAILPWGVEGGDKLSPVDASAQVLAHVREAWDHEHGDEGARFVDQEIMVTVPASFDEAARELTLEAAERAGFPPVVLLEEPQAAFYAWVNSHAGRRRELLGPGSRILVFDVGGGTTDFTLISVDREGEGLERTAVGDHLLLGGDNIDLTLAKQVEARAKRKLDPLQWHALVQACRLAKETLLRGDDERAPIAVAGRSSKLIGGTLRDEISRDELTATVEGGFFPEAEVGEGPARTRGGLQEFGLPFAADPGVTRHLASFLSRHQAGAIDAVLFNGGAMTPERLRRRVLDQIDAWQPERGAPRELRNELPELAVAKGAAYYGLVRRGLGARIRGGTARSYYVGVQGSDGGEMAVCLAPKGLEEGSRVELDRDFELLTNRPVSFKLFSSSTRDDEPGALLSVEDASDDLLELPPIVTVLRAPGRGQATVHLEVRITELGALEMSCRDRAGDGDERWKLSFDMRAGGAARDGEAAPVEDDPSLDEATELVRAAYRGGQEVTPQRLIKELERALKARRDEWSMTRTRKLFDTAFEVEEDRHKTADHEARWLNLTGFCLRPGTGAPLDEWRSKQMWRIFNQGMHHDRSEAVRLAWWIAWRRIAGGLKQGHQEQIYDRLAQLFLPGPKQKKKWYEYKPTKQEAAEMWRTLANLERLSPQHKQKLGDQLIERLQSKKNREDALYFWALGRIGSRVPLYGPLNCVVPSQVAGRWITALLDLDWPAPDKAAFPVAQLGRRTGDRSRDIDDELRARLAARLRETPGGDRTARLVEEIVALEAREERVALGDTLPAGLRLVADEDEESAPAPA